MPPSRCLAEETVARFIDGQLADDERASVDRHIGRCAECRALVADSARSLYGEDDSIGDCAVATSAETDVAERPIAADVASTLKPGQCVGRYVVGQLIGVGGMGIVYRAQDPQLNRPITLKLLRQDRRRGRGAQAQLLREAQAMAQLSHPNVVAVYDVGTYGAEVFLAMEYIEGETLRRWLDRHAAPRAWHVIRQAFVDAGLALTAAHAVGIVHRDFKPDNVLVGVDGRTRVTDFGLACPVTSGELSASSVELSSGTDSSFGDWDLAMTLTETGAVKGTPAYMAPEQFLGRAADARTDQFSFCVTLYEAIYGRRPFRSASVKRLAREIVGGDVVISGEASPLAPAAKAALLRGLSTGPEDRFPSIGELLAALDEASVIGTQTGRAVTRVRRWPLRLLLIAAAAALLGAVGAVAVYGIGTLARSSVPGQVERTNKRSASAPGPAAVRKEAPVPAAPHRRAPAGSRSSSAAADARPKASRRRPNRRLGKVKAAKPRARPYDDAPLVPSFARTRK